MHGNAGNYSGGGRLPLFGEGVGERVVGVERGGEKPWQPQRHAIDLSQWRTLQS